MEVKKEISNIKTVNALLTDGKLNSLIESISTAKKSLNELGKRISEKGKAFIKAEEESVAVVVDEVVEEVPVSKTVESTPVQEPEVEPVAVAETEVKVEPSTETPVETVSDEQPPVKKQEKIKPSEVDVEAELLKKKAEEERRKQEEYAKLSPEERAALKRADIAARQAELMRKRGMDPSQIKQRMEYVPTNDRPQRDRRERPTGDKPYGNKQQNAGQGQRQNGFGGNKSTQRVQPVEVAFVPKDTGKSYGNKKKSSEKSYDDKKAINKKSLIKGQVSVSDFDEDKTGYRKLRVKKQKKDDQIQAVKIEKAVITKDIIPIKELSEKLGITAIEITKMLFKEGIMKTINDSVDYDTAGFIAAELGIELELKVAKTAEEVLNESFDEDADDSVSVARPPVVTVMGHVDHGKTSILDRIRSTNVTEGEAGGITQHIGAYSVNVNGKSVTFLDTPGHEAFTSMRMRGAQITDIAVLVVAADDGVMPQTIEAINHAKAANVSIVVAANKIDKPTANLDKLRQELADHDILIEEWGGDVAFCPVSAKTGEGIDGLLETILLIAEVKELKANPDRKAKGSIIEAKLDKGKGPVATVLVQNGTLRQGDNVVAGTVIGRVRAMIDDKGRPVKEAGPSTAVSILGLESVPNAGDSLFAVDQDKLMKLVAQERKNKEREELIKQSEKVSLDDLFDKISEGSLKNLNVIIKGDVQGSVEAVKQSLVKLSNDEVKVNAVHAAVGAITETDVMLADSANAIIIGFNVRPDAKAKALAEQSKVDVKLYRIIYEAIEDMEKAMKGMLAPKFEEVYMGKAEVRETFKITGVGTVAGCYVTEGKVVRNSKLRIYRDDVMICEGNVLQLKRFKDDVKEVAQGYECGISIEGFNDIKVGDFIESYIVEEQKQ